MVQYLEGYFGMWATAGWGRLSKYFDSHISKTKACSDETEWALMWRDASRCFIHLFSRLSLLFSFLFPSRPPSARPAGSTLGPLPLPPPRVPEHVHPTPAQRHLPHPPGDAAALAALHPSTSALPAGERKSFHPLLSPPGSLWKI